MLNRRQALVKIAATVGGLSALSLLETNLAYALSLPQMFPSNHILNTPINHAPLHPLSDTYIASIGGSAAILSPDGWWSGIPGFPFTTATNAQPFVPINESYGDKGPYPIPPNAPVEVGTDAHVLVLNRDSSLLYEMFLAQVQPDNSWHCYAGAIFDTSSNTLRPLGLSSADAAGLPMLPLLIRYDEAASGVINHAIRVVVHQTQNTFLWPARTQAGIADITKPPAGLRLRLKARYDLSSFYGLGKVILQAMQTYGLIVADNGGKLNTFSPSGSPDTRFNYKDILQLKKLTAADFEAVDVSGLMIDVNSGQAT